MPQEYEYAFTDYNKKDIISKIKKMNGVHKGTFLIRVNVFIHPLEVSGTYIRVRDEGFRITMTYKYATSNKFLNEDEIIIDNFDNGVKILLGLGCKSKYYYEKIREIWKVKNTEIIFDTNPGIDDKLEVESNTKKELDKMVKYFGLTIEDRKNRYMDLYQMEIPKTLVVLTFQNVKKNLIKHVKKNKKKFIEITDKQLKKYKKIISK